MEDLDDDTLSSSNHSWIGYRIGKELEETTESVLISTTQPGIGDGCDGKWKAEGKVELQLSKSKEWVEKAFFEEASRGDPCQSRRH